MSKFIQFELWPDCGNKCAFCVGQGSRPVNNVESLEYVLNVLNTDKEVLEYDEIGIIGGEIFDSHLNDERVNELFYQMLDKISSMHFQKFYIATHLIYNIDIHLTKALEFLRRKGMSDKVLICTSYDTKWRFNTDEKFPLWEQNMYKLHQEFPEVKTHIETILTAHFIDRVLNNLEDIQEISQKYNSRIDFIAPTSGTGFVDKYECQEALGGDFFPTKASFVQFLNKVKGYVDLSTLCSMELRSNTIHALDDGERRIIRNRRAGEGKCELRDKSKKYDMGFIDSPESMRGVVVNFIELLGG